MAKGKKVSMYLQRAGRGILRSMWWQVGGEACFPSSVAPLSHGMGGKGLGARSWTSSPFTLGFPEHLGNPNPAQAHCMWSHHSNHVWPAPSFHAVQEQGQPPFSVSSISEQQCLYSQCLSEKAGVSEGRPDSLWIPTKFTNFILLYFMSYLLLFSLHHFIFHLADLIHALFCATCFSFLILLDSYPW